MRTTSRDAFDATAHPDPNKGQIGKRRAMLEAEMMKRALYVPYLVKIYVYLIIFNCKREEMKETPIDRSASEWVSTAHGDYSANNFKTTNLSMYYLALYTI